MKAVNLSPVLHSEHLFLLGSPGRPEHRLDPWLCSGRASRFQPAKGVQYSGAVDKSILVYENTTVSMRALGNMLRSDASPTMKVASGNR
jgi:hypothetical protein